MYTIQEQAEWAGNANGIDQDFEAETLEEARRIAAAIAKGGSYYIIYDEDYNRIEGTA